MTIDHKQHRNKRLRGLRFGKGLALAVMLGGLVFGVSNSKGYAGATYDVDYSTQTVYTGQNLAATHTFARNSAGYAQRLDGTWVAFTTNQMRMTDRGILIEEARTNLFLNSLAPVTQVITVINATAYTVTLFSTGGTLTLSGAGAGTVNPNVPVTFTSSSTSLTVTCNSPTGAFVCVNVEAGVFGTSPIATVGSPVLRAADDCFIASVSSYLSFTQGSIRTEWTERYGPVGGVNRAHWSLRAAGSDYMRSYLAVTTGRSWFEIIAATVNQAPLLFSTNAVAAGQTYKLATRWILNDCVVKYTAALGSPAVDTSAVMPTGVFTIAVGQSGANSLYFNGYIKRLTLFNVAQNDNQLNLLVA